MKNIEHTTKSVKQDHMDIAIQLHHMTKTSTQMIIGAYVKAHMDEEVENEDELTIEQSLNVCMDRLAGAYLRNLDEGNGLNPNAVIFPAQLVYLRKRGHPKSRI